MLRAEDNRFLTESGSGTPMGELLRRFWLPVLLSEELPEADGPPKKIVVLGEELQPALKSLRKSGINIVAIHHHMVGEEPRMIFFHYWGRGPAKDLADAVKTALQTTKTIAAPPK